MIRHIVLLTFAETATDGQIQAVEEALSQLPARLPEVKAYVIGRDLALNDANATFAVAADFDTVDDYVTYRDDPEHRRIIAEHISPILVSRAAAQYEISARVTDEAQLRGGVANAGSVTRVGDHVLRPANRHTASIHRFLSALRAGGFDGASFPAGIDPDGRERLRFIPGEVAIPPYPRWAQVDSALASIAQLMRRFHTAAQAMVTEGATWSDEMADPAGGSVVCHNDVCLENVVFENGTAVGLLDFAAPGRPIYDLAQMARMCIPLDDDLNAARFGWEPSNRPDRLRVVADAYGLDGNGRMELLEIVAMSIARSGEFVRRRVEAGDPNFTKIWNENGGMAPFDRRRRWWGEHRDAFAHALA